MEDQLGVQTCGVLYGKEGAIFWLYMDRGILLF